MISSFCKGDEADDKATDSESFTAVFASIEREKARKYIKRM